MPGGRKQGRSTGRTRAHVQVSASARNVGLLRLHVFLHVYIYASACVYMRVCACVHICCPGLTLEKW